MHGDFSTKARASASYAISLLLMCFGDVLQFLDAHAGAEGSLPAIATVCINLY